MFKSSVRQRIGHFLFCLLVLFVSVCWAWDEHSEVVADTKQVGWDPNKYIAIDEIKPGMEAYCLTSYQGTEVEKFGMEVLSVVRNIDPGRDAILVKGTDERFIRTGPVAGCSGSPVYVEGRLAGALAFAWTFSKDPIYGATPIKEILGTGKTGSSSENKTSSNFTKDEGVFWEPGFVFDFSGPIDFEDIYNQITTAHEPRRNSLNGIETLLCPLVTSGLPSSVCGQLDTSVRGLGFMVVGGVGSGGALSQKQSGASASGDPVLVPGDSLVIPLVSGDIRIEAVGTVAEVVGDKVYGFGHSFLGYGPIDLPMATGQVHTVVPSMIRSFKLATGLEIVGALTEDDSSAVRGRIGAEAKMIPLKVTVERYNAPETKVYKCLIVNNRLLTPLLLRTSVAGAALNLGNLPPDNMVEYEVVIGMENAEQIRFRNVSTNVGINDVVMEAVSAVALLMNNPYGKVRLESFDFDIRIVPKNVLSHIWSVGLSDSKVKPGETVDITIVIESKLSGKKRYQYSQEIPDDLPPGKYEMIICDSWFYEQFLVARAPYRFTPENLPTLIASVNNALAVERDKLYCLLVLPAGGVAISRAELPDLPATKALVLQDAKRALRALPYVQWLEKTFDTGTITRDKEVLHIIVED
ncbi:MAG: SpoIVB peptidase S55 domain-containing protein [Planctomycetota bacterium]